MYSNITKKDYINQVVNCSKLIPKNMDKNFKDCIEIFDYSIKYFILLLLEINNNDKKHEESDDDYSKRILRLFYKKMFNKIAYNIDSFYIQMYKKDINYIQKKIENLVSLNESIYQEKVYTLRELYLTIKSFPVKYLNIYMVYNDSKTIPLDQINITKFRFFFDYTNNFIRQTINRIIDESSSIYKNVKLGGGGYGTIFEDLVNEKLSKLIFDNQPISIRNVFSLVGTQIKSYINNLRQKEATESSNFFNLKQYTLFMDGFDIEKITKSIFDITKFDVFLNQVSKGGRSFDSAILKKLPNIPENNDNNNNNNNNPTHDLILTQSTKEKIIQCKDKSDYIIDSDLSKNFLENTYENLKINKIYFFFILPSQLNVSETIKKLNDNKIYYIFYDSYNKNFLNKESKIIYDFRIPEAEISFDDIDFSVTKALSDIRVSKNVMNISVRNYLGKKRLYDNNFINVYNKISEDNHFSCITIPIPKNLKKNIVDIFYKENIVNQGTNINFIPSTNFSFNELKKIKLNEKIMIIFSHDNKIYLYYIYYFLIKDNYSIEKINFEADDNFEMETTTLPKKNLKTFIDIKQYPLFCFCFNVIEDYNFNNFN